MEYKIQYHFRRTPVENKPAASQICKLNKCVSTQLDYQFCNLKHWEQVWQHLLSKKDMLTEMYFCFSLVKQNPSQFPILPVTDDKQPSLTAIQV